MLVFLALVSVGSVFWRCWVALLLFIVFVGCGYSSLVLPRYRKYFELRFCSFLFVRFSSFCFCCSVFLNSYKLSRHEAID